MIGHWLLALTLALMSGAVVAEDCTILILGDSLSAAYGIPIEAGWVERLQGDLRAQDKACTVVNASVSGETTAGGLTRLPGLLARHRPDVVVIELGSNDGLRGTALTAIEGNLEVLVTLAQEAGARVLILGMQLPPNYGPQYSERFFDLFGEVAARRDAALVPFFLQGVATREDWLQVDRLHPTAAPQGLLAERVAHALAPLLPGQAAAHRTP
jgi:acyl-CoA thioesterase-1